MKKTIEEIWSEIDNKKENNQKKLNEFITAVTSYCISNSLTFMIDGSLFELSKYILGDYQNNLAEQLPSIYKWIEKNLEFMRSKHGKIVFAYDYNSSRCVVYGVSEDIYPTVISKSSERNFVINYHK